MNPTFLTENGWKTICRDAKIKDTRLLQALAAYEGAGKDDLEGQLKELGTIGQVADGLKKNREVASNAEAAKYLVEVVNAAKSQRQAVLKAKEAADKAAATTRKQAEAQAKQAGHDEAEQEGDYPAKLLAALQKLKSAKDLSFEFIVCDAKPVCGVMVAKKITPKHKEELTRVTGGSKRFLHTGLCHFENGHYVFSMEQPVSGLARKLQDSLKNFTGKKFPIVAGAESAEDDEGQSAAQQAAGSRSPQRQVLEKAPDLWRSAQSEVATKINLLKQAVRKEFAGEPPQRIAQIEQNMARFDEILGKLDHKLADSLAKAHAAKEAAALHAELNHSKALLADYIKFVKSEEKLIAHIDSNPFGVQTNLKQLLSERLTEVARAIG